MTLLRMDELNRLKEKLILKLQTVDRNRLKEIGIEDDVFSLLEMAYMFGAEDVLYSDDKYIDEGNKVAETGDLSLQNIVDYAVLEETVGKPIGGKTTPERVSEYTESGDVEALVKVVDTESHRVYNAGSYDTATKLGYKTKTWVTMNDNRVRDTHDYIEGMTVPMGARFYTYDGDSARWPGDFNNAENNVNCRCVLVYGKE